MTENERRVPPEVWGRALLEEVLFRAAEQLPGVSEGRDDVRVSLDFRIVADLDEDTLLISTMGNDGTPLVAFVSRPF